MPSTSTPSWAGQTIVVEDRESLEPYLDAWDALAVEHSRPFCAPAWMLSWWSEARTGDARLRVVLVSDEQGLAGVGPFFAEVGPLGLVEMRLLGAGFCHRIGPLARAGAETRSRRPWRRPWRPCIPARRASCSRAWTTPIRGPS